MLKSLFNQTAATRLLSLFVILMLMATHAFGAKTDPLCYTNRCNDREVQVEVQLPEGVSLQYKAVTSTGETVTDWTHVTKPNYSNFSTMIPTGGKVYFRADGVNSTVEGLNIRTSTYEGYVDLSGNVMTLLRADGDVDAVPERCFKGLFYNDNGIVNAKDLELPALSVGDSGYEIMFGYDYNLISIPKLPATTLGKCAYQNMFCICQALEDASIELPAEVVPNNAYSFMFDSCTKLQNAPEIKAVTLGEYACYGMFSACTALKKAPKLTATTLAWNCYRQIFSSCQSLESIEVAFEHWVDGTTEDWVFNCPSGVLFKCPASLESDIEAMENRGTSNVPESWIVNGKCHINLGKSGYSIIDEDGLVYSTYFFNHPLTIPAGIDVYLPAGGAGIYGRTEGTIFPSKPLLAGQVIPARTPFMMRTEKAITEATDYIFMVTETAGETVNATTCGLPKGTDFILSGTTKGYQTPYGSSERLYRLNSGTESEPQVHFYHDESIYGFDPCVAFISTQRENSLYNEFKIFMVFDDVLLDEYKTERAEYVNTNFPQSDDSQASTKIITDAVTAINNLAYSKAETLYENKARVDAIIANLKNNLWKQRKAELEAYKTTRKADIDALALSADRWGAKALITQAKNDVGAVAFDTTLPPDTKTLTYHKGLVDAIFNTLVNTDLPAQRAFEAEEDRVITENVNVKIETGDCAACTKIINDCKKAIYALPYDKEKTREQNFARITPLVTKLYDDLVTQRTSDLNAYKTAKQTAAGGMKEKVDAQDVPAIIAAAKTSIGNVAYTKEKTLAEQKSSVDALITQLGTDLVTERTRCYNLYKATAKANADAKLVSGHSSDACIAVVDGVKDDIEARAYDKGMTYAANLKALDDLVASLYYKGDINGDNKVDILDVTEWVALAKAGTLTNRCDVDGNGTTNLSDLEQLVKYVSGSSIWSLSR